jgi:hypothetical protein
MIQKETIIMMRRNKNGNKGKEFGGIYGVLIIVNNGILMKQIQE